MLGLVELSQLTVEEWVGVTLAGVTELTSLGPLHRGTSVESCPVRAVY